MKTFAAILFLFLLPDGWASTDRASVQWQLKDAWGDLVQYDQKQQQQPTVLFFWASWCPFCHKLMPGFQRIYNDYSDKGVTIYSINVWETGDALAYMFDHEYEFPVLVDGEKVAARYGVKGTPALFVIAPDGEIRYQRHEGDSPASVEAQARKALDQLLK